MRCNHCFQSLLISDFHDVPNWFLLRVGHTFVYDEPVCTKQHDKEKRSGEVDQWRRREWAQTEHLRKLRRIYSFLTQSLWIAHVRPVRRRGGEKEEKRRRGKRRRSEMKRGGKEEKRTSTQWIIQGEVSISRCSKSVRSTNSRKKLIGIKIKHSQLRMLVNKSILSYRCA